MQRAIDQQRDRLGYRHYSAPVSNTTVGRPGDPRLHAEFEPGLQHQPPRQAR